MITLEDPQFHIPNKVDILIEAEILWDSICADEITCKQKQPLLQGIMLGCIAAVRVDSGGCSSMCHLSVREIQEQLQRFWHLEDCKLKAFLSGRD